MVAGDGRPFVVALIVSPIPTGRPPGPPPRPGPTTSPPWPTTRISAARSTPPVDRANRRLATPETVRRFLVAPEPFSLANGQLTPTLKVRRHIVLSAYGDRLKRLYDR